MKAERLKPPELGVTEPGWYAVQNGRVISKCFVSEAAVDAWIKDHQGGGGPPPPASPPPPPSPKPDDDDDPEPDDGGNTPSFR